MNAALLTRRLCGLSAPARLVFPHNPPGAHTGTSIGLVSIQSHSFHPNKCKSRWSCQLSQYGTVALVRGVPATFGNCLTMEPLVSPIDLPKARQQHAAYVAVLRGLVDHVVEVPPDEAHPDCPFIEDTAVVIGRRALITLPGAPSRRGEVPAVKRALEELGVETVEAQEPARIDGGDVLHFGGCVFVGLTSRTNGAGVAALQLAFPQEKIVPLEVGPGGLHLKSVVSKLNEVDALVAEDHPVARELFKAISKHVPHATCTIVPDVGAANTVCVFGTVLFPSAYSQETSSAYEKLNMSVIPVDLSEFHKADGGLSCLSILIDM